MRSRRSLLKVGVAAAIADLAGQSGTLAARRMKLLVLGGTHMLGPSIVRQAVAHGHEVTLFNRGKTNPSLFAELELIRGDREIVSQDLSGLEGSRTWDAVIDVWPSDPRMAEAAGRLLADRVRRYVYISSIVAYKDLRQVGLTESAALFDDPSDSAAWYEFGKAESERRLMAIYGDRYSSCRSHIILGGRQDSDTLRFWLVRIARGGDVLAPGERTAPVQFVDVNDLGAFALRLAEDGPTGPFNVAGPNPRMEMGELLDRLNRATGRHARLIWTDDDFLTRQRVHYFSDLPLYVPLAHARKVGFMQVDIGRALASGLRLRPIEQTAADELRWFRQTLPSDYEFGVGTSNKGFPRARELEILAAWKAEGHGAEN